MHFIDMYDHGDVSTAYLFGCGEPIHYFFLLIHNMWICVAAAEAATHLRD